MSLEALLSAPSFTEFCADFVRCSGRPGRLPVVVTLPADTLTPVGAYLRLRNRSSHSFLFESVEGGEHLARYSFVGFAPTLLFRSWDQRIELEWREGPAAGQVSASEGDPLALLRQLTQRAPLIDKDGLPRFLGGAVGFFGYDSVRLIERVPRDNPDTLGTPDINLAFHDRLIAFDHLRAIAHAVRLVEVRGTESEAELKPLWEEACAELQQLRADLSGPLPQLPSGPMDSRPPSDPTFESTETEASFTAKVAIAKEHILAGDVFQVVLSQRLSTDISCDPFAIYRADRMVNPSPYLFHLAMGEHTLVGASPEMLVRAEQAHVQTLPIAGTRRRGENEAEDQVLADDLLADPKECAEHQMLVDLGRNDIGRVARFGSVAIPQHMVIQRFSHVMHMVSRVTGTLREDVDSLDALYACFPAGTVSGAPKVRAMEIIDAQETTARGVYAGAVGYLDYRGDLDTCIAIRTVVVHKGRAHVQAGAGIVADSVPQLEFEETLAKAKALLQAIRLAEGGLLGTSPEGGQ